MPRNLVIKPTGSLPRITPTTNDKSQQGGHYERFNTNEDIDLKKNNNNNNNNNHYESLDTEADRSGNLYNTEEVTKSLTVQNNNDNNKNNNNNSPPVATPNAYGLEEKKLQEQQQQSQPQSQPQASNYNIDRARKSTSH